MSACPHRLRCAPLKFVLRGNQARVFAVPPHQGGLLRRHPKQPSEERVGLPILIRVEGDEDFGDRVVQRGTNEVERPVSGPTEQSCDPRLILERKDHAGPGGSREFLPHQVCEFWVGAGFVFGEPQVVDQLNTRVVHQRFGDGVQVLPFRRQRQQS